MRKDFLIELEKHLKVVIEKGFSRKTKGSPFASFHDAEEGVFYISESDSESFETMSHEFGHFVAWFLSGKPEGDNFGCDGEDFGISSELERDACCVEIAIRSRKGEDFASISRRALQEYSYEEELEWVEDVGYVGGDDHVREMIALGEVLLSDYLNLSGLTHDFAISEHGPRTGRG